MMKTSPLIALALIVATAGAAAPVRPRSAGRPESEAVARLHALYAAELVALADELRRQRVYNDGESTLLEARRWGGTEAWERVADRRIEALCAERKTWWVDGARESYRTYVTSKRYQTARSRLMRKRADIDREAAKRALQLAMAALKEQRPAEAEEALMFVSRVDATVARRLGGNARRAWRRVRAEHAAAGLARLELGETTSHLDVSLQDLKGKVVLWRSKSL